MQKCRPRFKSRQPTAFCTHLQTHVSNQNNQHHQISTKENHLQLLRRIPKKIHVNHRIVEDIPNRQPKQVIDYLQFEYQCTNCHTHATANHHPDCPPDGAFGKNSLIQTMLLKFEKQLPFEKISQQMQLYSLPMTPATSLDITRCVSEYLTGEYEIVLGKFRLAKVLYIDETSMKVDGKNFWM